MNKNKNELNSNLLKNINEIESQLQNLITSNSEKLDKESIEEIIATLKSEGFEVRIINETFN